MRATVWAINRKAPDCYECEHRHDLIGDAHSSCDALSANVIGNRHGIEHGWFFWPFNFDPTWLEMCDSFKQKEKDGKH